MSTSLLLILIIMLWLSVPIPLMINTRRSICHISDVLGKTRVLHRGGGELAMVHRRPSFKESDACVTEEVNDPFETVDVQADDNFDASDVLIGDTTDEVADLTVAGGDIVYELEAADVEEGTPQADNPATEEVVAEYSDCSDVDASNSESADQSLQAVVDDEGVEPNSAVASAEGDVIRADESPSDVGVDVRRQFVDVNDLMFEDAVKSDVEALFETEETADTIDEQTTPDETVEDDSDYSAGSNGEPIVVDDTLTGDDYAFAEKCRGRGGFDPVLNAQYAETHFARYRRSIAGPVASIAATTVIAAFTGGWTWWTSLIGVSLMTLYLVSLRHTVHTEQGLRAHRIRRMKMARLGVYNCEDDELGIPRRLRRLGTVVVELDDGDPDFADLAHTDYRFDDGDYDKMPQTRVS